MFFEELKKLFPNLNPGSIFSDFEQAIVKAVRFSFPSARQQFCFFHFCQNIYRKLCAVGLKTNYDQEAEFSHSIRMLLALAFVPSVDAIKAFEALKEKGEISDEANDVFDYFEDNYIGRLDVCCNTLSKRRDPRFAIESWNVHRAVQEEIPRTNNSLEGWHNGFAKLVAAEHPTIWDFLDKLQFEQSKNELVLQQIFAGMPMPPKKKEIP